MPNRLSFESSPYLKQHQNNPVDWYAWGEEALTRAKVENKPIHLSVGYSACHWCHVMAHECFENPEIAKLMNENFINIKVDREERPDLDQVYQNVAQIYTQGGGWPLTVFLTPELKPFFGGTYFPPEDRYGRPGFPRVLQALSESYRRQPQMVFENAEKVFEAIRSLETLELDDTEFPTLESLKGVGEELLSHIDWDLGGLAGAPKFPNPMLLSFLWRLGLTLNWPEPKRAAVIALERMAHGGIYDHLGGGFHRYSVDDRWAVPHFEKMLYDNALLLKLYSEVVLSDKNSKNPILTDDRRNLFLDVISQTVDYILREMQSPEGGFYSAQDADSEGEEGKYFVWTPQDLKNHLNQEEAAAFGVRYGVNEIGNFEHNATVLFHANSLSEVAQALKLSKNQGEERVRELIASARQKLLSVRKKREAPLRDNKILVAWNGLAISGLAWASAALSESGRKEEASSALAASKKAYYFVKEKLSRGEGRLFSNFQNGEPRVNGFLDDYAFLAMAALDLARAGIDIPSLISDCELWMRAVMRHFSDTSGTVRINKNGYFFTSDDHEELIQRPKTIHDQAIPSGSAVALTCMLVLSELKISCSELDFSNEVKNQLSYLFPLAKKQSLGLGELLSLSLLFTQGPISVRGKDLDEICWHPHVFRGLISDPTPMILVCHKKVCSLPLQDLSEARAEVERRLGYLLS